MKHNQTAQSAAAVDGVGNSLNAYAVTIVCAALEDARCLLDEALAAVREARAVEELLEIQKRLFIHLARRIPLGPRVCHFCVTPPESCAECRYAEYHGACEEFLSDYQTIIRARGALLCALERYYLGESYSGSSGQQTIS